MRVPIAVARVLLHPAFRVALYHRLPWAVQRAALNLLAAGQPLPPGTLRRPTRLGARRAEQITVGDASGTEAILYLHGGGYTVGSIATHRSLAAHLADATRRPVYLLDYRLAPEHPFPAALDDTLAAYDALTAQGHEPGAIALAGDSAGGALALAAAQHLVARGRGTPSPSPAASSAAAHSTPGALLLLSPWVDPQLRADRRRDLVTSRAWGDACGAAYRGAADPHDPRYAPLRGPLAGLPPTFLFTAVRELLYPQCRDLAAALRDAGVLVRYEESPVLWHAAQVQAGLVAEAAASVRAAGDFLTSHGLARTGS